MTPWSTTIGDKAACRQAFLDGISSRIDRPTDFFVLPSTDAHDVALIKDRWPKSRVIGVERDAKVFEHIQQTHFNVHAYKMTVGQYVEREAEHPSGTTFDAAFLDYTGMLTRDNLHDVCAFVSHLAKPSFVLGLTFQKNPRKMRESIRALVLDHTWLEDEHHDAVEEEDSNDWNSARYIADTVCVALERTLRSKLQGISILNSMEYNAVEGSTTMHFMTIGLEFQ